ncbi:MAG: TetR/AcrR family transcriptional regulator C-terminal domain-containing protein [Bullifex sp.]
MSEDTKRLIAEAFRQAASEKSVSRITVQDIAARAGISRHTFYYHFRDIADMTRWIFSSECLPELTEFSGIDNWQEGLKRACCYAVENRQLVIGIYRSVYRDNLFRFIFELVYSMIDSIIDREFSDIYVCQEDRKALITFYTYGCMGTLHGWLDGNMEEDYGKVLAVLHKVVHGAVRDALIRLSGETDGIC